MSRSVFGWSYPPGAASDPNAPWNQNDDGPCEVCCKPVDLCICPECPHCGAVGAPHCYTNDHKAEHGVRFMLSREQIMSREEARIAVLEERVRERKSGLEWMRDHEDWGLASEDCDLFSDDLNIN